MTAVQFLMPKPETELQVNIQIFLLPPIRKLRTNPAIQSFKGDLFLKTKSINTTKENNLLNQIALEFHQGQSFFFLLFIDLYIHLMQPVYDI